MVPSGATFGALAALGAAGMWALGTVLVGRALRRGPGGPTAAAANLYKNGLAALMFGAGWLVTRDAAPSADAAHALFWSGFLGFAVGDTLYFAAVQHCGAHLAAMLGNLAGPVAALLAFVFLGEELSTALLLAMAIVVAGILLVLSDPTRARAGGVVHGRGGRLALGVALGAAAGTSWGVSIVAGHAGFAGLGVMPGTLARLAAGLVGAAVLALGLDLLRTARGRERGELVALVRPFHHLPSARLLFVPALFAALLTLPLHSLALREAPGGVAAVLFATTPLYTLPIAWALGERSGWRTSAGTLVGFAGVAGVLLLGGEPAAAAAEDEPGPELSVRELAHPAAPRSSLPNLARGGDGALYLSWVEHGPERLAVLRFARWDGERFGPAREIARGRDWFVNWADFPVLSALEGGELIACWLQKSSSGKYSYDVRFALSGDGGETWSESAVLHSDRQPQEHGFVSLVPLDRERFAAIWLDGRRLAEPDGAMSLVSRTVGSDGALGPETTIDPRVCDCCQTALALLPGGGLLAAYRDRGDDERRDMSFAVLEDGAWSAPRDVFPDGWIHYQCPVNGPSLDVSRGVRAVAWYTEGGGELAGSGSPLVRVAFGAEGGSGFGLPRAVDEGDPLGRPDLVLLPSGEALVIWLEREAGDEDAERAAWRFRTARPDGERLGAPRTLDVVPATRPSGFARLAADGDGALVAWTVPGPDGGIRVARLGR